MFLCGEYENFKGTKELLESLLSQVNNNTNYTNNTNNTKICNTHTIQNNIVSPRAMSESKYQSESQLKKALSIKFKKSIPYMFIHINNFITKEYNISSTELLDFILSCIEIKNRKTFTDNILKELYNSVIFYNYDKLRILFTLLNNNKWWRRF